MFSAISCYIAGGPNGYLPPTRVNIDYTAQGKSPMNTRPLPSKRRQSAAAQQPTFDLWRLIWGRPYIDAGRLAQAIELELKNAPPSDYRSRLLVRDAAQAVRSFWGEKRFTLWLAASPAGPKVRRILDEELGEIGFPFIRRRLVASIGSVEVKQIFDLLGRKIHDRIEVDIAGSIPTLIKGMTARPTADIDFVNEVPLEIRKQRRVLKKIEDEYGLQLTHVQSHYLPIRWETRRHYLGDHGGLRVYLVDEYDIFVSKLSSAREKHKQDIRVLAGILDKQTAQRRLLTDGKAFLDEPRIRRRIEENWQFIYQEALSLVPAPAAPKRRPHAKTKGKPPAKVRKRRPDPPTSSL